MLTFQILITPKINLARRIPDTMEYKVVVKKEAEGFLILMRSEGHEKNCTSVFNKLKIFQSWMFRLYRKIDYDLEIDSIKISSNQFFRISRLGINFIFTKRKRICVDYSMNFRVALVFFLSLSFSGRVEDYWTCKSMWNSLGVEILWEFEI